jgi:hypothetical protein
MNSITRRIERLEASILMGMETTFSVPARDGRGRQRLFGSPVPALKIRIGHVRRLPADYKGERHIVIGKRLPDKEPGDWYEFEEVAGPAPAQPPLDPRRPRYMDIVFVPPYPEPS